MKKTTTRKLEETSWLAQSLRDMMSVEFEKNGISRRYLTMLTLKILVNEADDKNNPFDIHFYHDEYTCSLLLVIPYIPSLMKHGSDYSQEGMRGKLMGMQVSYHEAVSVKTTHDLNSAIINVSRLMDAIRQ